MNMRWKGFRKVRGQVCKRVRRRQKELGLDDYEGYRSYLQDNPEEWKVVDHMARITISRFFRDRKSWMELGNKLLPQIVHKANACKRTVRCWTAGCASGEEPYSFTILWREKILPAFPDASLELVATDADSYLLKRARHACYKPGSLKEIPREWKEKAFYRDDSAYCLSDPYHKMAHFYQQDIREEMPEGEFDLIFCKNIVAMYFEKKLAVSIFRKISEKMRQGAFLFLGSHEEFPLDEVRNIKEFDRKLQIYRKDFTDYAGCNHGSFIRTNQVT